MNLPSRWQFTLALACAPGLAAAQAQASLKPDGHFRYALGAGASYSAGNTDASNVNLSADAVRATADSKWELGGKALWGRSGDTTTAENVTLGTQIDRNFTVDWFSLGKVDYLRDKPANVATRVSLFGGAGYHVVRRDTLSFDLTAGLGYTQDRYFNPIEVSGEQRSRFGRAEILLGEESTQKWTATTSVHQKLSLYPSLGSTDYRALFDSGMSVAINGSLSLTAGLSYRYNSDPGTGLKRGDTLFVTGLSMKLD
jgi:putative salt-induced outer membrane protein YdiY